MNKKNKENIGKLLLIVLALVFIVSSISYAYFSASVSNNGNQMIVTTGHMQVRYTEGNVIGTTTNLIPGNYIEKQFTVENIGNVDTVYNIYLNDVVNTFADKNDLVYELISEDGQNIVQTVCPSSNQRIASNIPIAVNQTHHYTLKITFLETNDNQNDNKGKSFTSSISLEEATNNNSNLIAQSDIDYSDSLNEIFNPDRGLYFPFPIEIDPTTDEFVSSDYNLQTRINNAKNSKSSLIMMEIDISELSGNANSSDLDKNFSNTELNSLNDMMSTLRDNNMKAIVRFAYTFERDLYQEPKSFNTILNQISSLSDFFEDNKDVIMVVQAGFLGPWGEMHSSLYQEDTYYYQLIDALLSAVPEDLTISVRTPRHYKIYFNTLNNSNVNKYRVGVFNDGYFGSSTDYGTFNSSNTREEFVEWMKVQGTHTFYGGETALETSVASDPTEYAYSDGSFAVSEMVNTHTSYLNSKYDTKILDDKWKVQYFSGGEYNNQTYYKYIGDHLGYRYVIRNSLISNSVGQGDSASLRLSLENVGFANIIPKQNTYLILQKDDIYYQLLTDIDFRNINGSSTSNINLDFSIPSDITTGVWNVYLKVCNQLNCNYAVSFANNNIYNNALKANYVGKLNITTKESSNVKFKQLGTNNPNEGTINTVPIVVPEEEKVSLKIEYCIYDTNTEISRQNITIVPNTTIDFSNSTQLENLGIILPSGYRFRYVTSSFVDWHGYTSITIPNEEENTIEVYLSLADTVAIEFSYWYNGDEISTQNVNVRPGTIISTTDDIFEIPSGHTIDHLTSALVGWEDVSSITIPSSNYDSSYYIEIYLN